MRDGAATIIIRRRSGDPAAAVGCGFLCRNANGKERKIACTVLGGPPRKLIIFRSDICMASRQPLAYACSLSY